MTGRTAIPVSRENHMAKASAVNRIEGLVEEQTTNGAKSTIDLSLPYRALIEVTGVAPLLFHAWNVESVDAKGKAAKGSKAKKEDDVESYVYRTPEGFLGVPGVNFVGSMIEAARYKQDPRSPRKSLRDLARAAIVALDTVAPFHPKTKEYDYLDKRRVTIQRAGITRTRPAMKEGWSLTFSVLVTLPEYMPKESLQALASDAGRLVGLCDHRPTYGRFTVTGFVIEEA